VHRCLLRHWLLHRWLLRCWRRRQASWLLLLLRLRMLLPASHATGSREPPQIAVREQRRRFQRCQRQQPVRSADPVATAAAAARRRQPLALRSAARLQPLGLRPRLQRPVRQLRVFLLGVGRCACSVKKKTRSWDAQVMDAATATLPTNVLGCDASTV